MTLTGEAKRAYQREWCAKRRAEYLADKCCAMCGSTEDLEVDHIDRATKVSHRIWSWAESKRMAELEKCQVLCGDHHQIKTNIERSMAGLARGHGTNYAYSKLRCKCDECREWKRRTEGRKPKPP